MVARTTGRIILRNPNGNLCVAYLNWNDDRWVVNFNRVANDWNDNDRLARCQSLHAVTPAKVREFTFERIVNFLSNRQALCRRKKVSARVRHICLRLFPLLPREPSQKISGCPVCGLIAIKNLIYLRVLCIARSKQVPKYLRIIRLFFCRACSA